MNTSIMIRRHVKHKLDGLRVSPTQAYTDIIERLIDKAPKNIWSMDEVDNNE